MVLTNDALTKVVNLIGAELSTGEWGTGTSTPSVTDSDLETPTAGTSFSLTKTVSGPTIQMTHTLPSTSGNGNTLTEYGNKFSDSTLLNRVLIGGIVKTSSIEINTITAMTVKNG